MHVARDAQITQDTRITHANDWLALYLNDEQAPNVRVGGKCLDELTRPKQGACMKDSKFCALRAAGSGVCHQGRPAAVLALPPGGGSGGSLPQDGPHLPVAARPQVHVLDMKHPDKLSFHRYAQVRQVTGPHLPVAACPQVHVTNPKWKHGKAEQPKDTHLSAGLTKPDRSVGPTSRWQPAFRQQVCTLPLVRSGSWAWCVGQ